MIKRDKIVRKRSLKELRREREEKRDDALRQHEELRKADLQSKRVEGKVRHNSTKRPGGGRVELRRLHCYRRSPPRYRN